MAVFARVVDKGSFRGAAQVLAVSPSVVSHHVSQLEQYLGVTLLYRSTRKLSLTEDGRHFYLSCCAMLAAAEEGLDKIADATESLSGELRVAVPAFLTATGFMEDAAAFANAHPKVQLNISFDDQLRDLMTEGFDLAIRISVGDMADSSMRARRLLTVDAVVVGSPRYLADWPRPKKLTDLAKHKWVLGSRNSFDFVDSNGRQQTLKVEPRIHIDSAHAAHGFALQHIGLAVLPSHLVEDDIASGRLERVLPDWKLASAAFYAIWPPNAGRTSLSFRFVDFLSEQIAIRVANGEMEA